MFPYRRRYFNFMNPLGLGDVFAIDMPEKNRIWVPMHRFKNQHPLLAIYAFGNINPDYALENLNGKSNTFE